MSIYNTVIKSGGGTQIIQIPSAATTTFSYDGTQKSLTLSNYDSSFVTARNISATTAGNYTAVFSLKDISATIWSDNSTTDKTISWTINKAPRSITLSKSSVTLNKNKLSDTVSISFIGDGTLSAISSDTDIVDVSVSNNVVTITSTDNAGGNETVTVSVTGSNNYADMSAIIDVTADFVKIYGAEWDGTSTTAWTRTDAAAGFSDPVPYVAGANSYGSPFDDKMPWAGMVKSERTGGTMVAIPKFWYKLTQSGKSIKIQIADGYVEGYSVSPAHMDRGDGHGERDMVYIGRYHCADDYKSKTGVTPRTDDFRSTTRSGIHNLGNNIWQCDFAMRFTIWLLYIVEFANWNSQAKIGTGCGNGSSKEDMGYTDSMPYHTGITQSNRTSYGLGTQYRNIEGLWDNVVDWMDGCYCNSSGLNIIMNPSSFNDSSGGTSIGTPYEGTPSAFSVKNVPGTFPTFIPISAGGSTNTYSCDEWGFKSYRQCLCVGGCYEHYMEYGLLYIGIYNSSGTSGAVGCRLMELP